MLRYARNGVALRSFLSLVICIFASSCASYKNFQYLTEEFEIPTKVYAAGYTKTWEAIKTIVDANGYPVELSNQVSGVWKTRWMDNTLQINFNEAFTSSESVKGAKFKLIINVIKGFRGKKEVTKVQIFKRQMIENDLLQGWKVVPSDYILEKTILYRIGRLLVIERKLQLIEDKRSKEAEESFF